jgi:hypothetical protein
MADTT